MEVEMSVYVSQALKTPLLRLDLRPLTPPLDSLSLSLSRATERASEQMRGDGRSGARKPAYWNVRHPASPSLSLFSSSLESPRKQGVVCSLSCLQCGTYNNCGVPFAS